MVLAVVKHPLGVAQGILLGDEAGLIVVIIDLFTARRVNFRGLPASPICARSCSFGPGCRAETCPWAS